MSEDIEKLVKSNKLLRFLKRLAQFFSIWFICLTLTLYLVANINTEEIFLYCYLISLFGMIICVFWYVLAKMIIEKNVLYNKLEEMEKYYNLHYGGNPQQDIKRLLETGKPFTLKEKRKKRFIPHKEGFLEVDL
jgi:hypothetical protein